jgi:hypothetical protein
VDRNDNSRNSSPPTQAPQKCRATRREAEWTKESRPEPSLAILDTGSGPIARGASAGSERIQYETGRPVASPALIPTNGVDVARKGLS